METGRNKGLEQIMGLIQTEEKDASSLKIVNFTILIDFFSMIPKDDLEKYLASYLESKDIPDVGSLKFKAWLKNFRKKLGLTQKDLASQLSEIDPNLKCHGSDIGNLETGNDRVKNYGPTRQERFKKALSLLQRKTDTAKP